MKPFWGRRSHRSRRDAQLITHAEFADDDDRPSEQTLHVCTLLDRGFTLTDVATLTTVPDALVQLIAEELAEAPWSRAPRSTDGAPRTLGAP